MFVPIFAGTFEIQQRSLRSHGKLFGVVFFEQANSKYYDVKSRLKVFKSAR